MKLIKKNTTTTTLKNRFTVGQPLTWTTTFFDGRVTTLIPHQGTIVKINQVTVDVQLQNGDVVRLDEQDLRTAK